MGDINEQYPFGDDFQRKILILAVRSNLVAETNGAFQAQFFGSSDAASDAKPPRQIIAEIIEKFTSSSNERPGVSTMDELIRERSSILRPQIKSQLENEWELVKDTEVSDPEYVTSRVCAWARNIGTLGAFVRGGKAIQDALKTGSEIDLQSVMADVSKYASVGSSGSKRGGLWLDSDDLDYWKDATDGKSCVPTKLGPLDAAFRGGPRYGNLIFGIAPPKGSKTVLLGNVCVGASQSQKGSAYFSYEMGFDEMRIRLDRRLMRRDRVGIMSDLSALRRAKHSMRASQAGEVWLEQCNPSKFGCLEIRRRVDRLRGEGLEIDLVIIDYLNLMVGRTASGGRDWRHELISISREMKDLAVDLDVVVWSATLCNRQAVDKVKIRKADIAEAFEVIAVCDGAIGICADETMRAANLKNLYSTAMRDAEDEKFAGTYKVDLDRMLYSAVDLKQVFMEKQEKEKIEKKQTNYMDIEED